MKSSTPFLCLILTIIISISNADDRVYLEVEEMFVDFPGGTPSFTIRPSVNSSFFSTFKFNTISELDSSGNVKHVSQFPSDYYKNKTTYSTENDTLHFQLLQFNTSVNNAQLLAYVTLVYYNGTESEYNITFSNTSKVSLLPYKPACHFQAEVLNWPYLSHENELQISASVSVNIDVLSVAYSTSSEYYTLIVPYHAQDTLLSKVSRLGVVDNVSVEVITSFEVSSYSQPIGADISIKFPHSNRSISYDAFSMVSNYNFSISTLSIIIILVIIIFVIGIFAIGIGCGLRYYSKLKEKKVERINDEDLDRNETSLNSLENDRL